MNESIAPAINIVYHDGDLVVVNKPSGLLCVPGLKEPDNLFDRVKSHFANARVVHRLDMSTSGLVIFALNHPAQKTLGAMFEHKKVHKHYVAEVSGCLMMNHGEIVAPLICDWDNRPRQIVDWHSGKKAQTAYHVIKKNNDRSRVILSPISGRTHQLRLHMLFIGHPILGDNLYNQENSHTLADRLLLHAWKLGFHHPIGNHPINLECPPEF